ncbi:tetratricopeptide repeat protein [Thermomonas brevis]|uniref:Tetratricopeptide repeat protein n=1 Tax=Thermomonas brevis TaxID=215691 RepID=A0A7G9QRC5_9GAMM|nr:tetratricopeptide repeat protein [Thermomonas brevis]QNN45900.1 tetratricopeptide repeat protein [Thermomonas brevis]
MPNPQRSGSRTFLLALLLACAPVAMAGKPGNAPVRIDPLEASMAGEFALQGGQLPEAARHYLDAARAAQDPVLAERATRIALLADQDALARDAFGVWQALAPQSSADARMVAASLALRAGQKTAARRELRALLTADKGWQEALAALAGAVGKQPKLVVAMLGEIVDRGELPDQLQAWLGFGGLAQRLEQPKLVDRIVQQVVARFPGEPRVALLRAQLLREGGKLAEARVALAGLEEPARLSPPLRWALAGEYEALGDAGKAAQVLAFGAQDDAAYARRAALLDKAGDKAGLAALYDELKRGATSPNPMRRLLLGQLAELLQRYDEALGWYANVPGQQAQGMARLRAANVLHAMGRSAQAYEDLHAIQSDAAVDDDAHRDGYLLEAELRQKDKDAAGEQDAYARGLAALPDNPELLYARALMWERQDRIGKAEADLRRLLVIEPDNVAALNALGYTLADRTDRYREALELIDRARVAEPGNAAIIDSYGWVLFKLGKARAALDHLRHAYALQEDPDIASHLGQVLWALGQKDEARHYFDAARKLDPDNRSLQRAMQETGA